MGRRKRPTYSPEFRAEALRRVRTSSDSIATIARDLGITERSLRTWMKASLPQPETPLSVDERTELQQLRREVAQLRMEREILKKATAFFAKQSE
jgi:transposase